MISSLFLRKRGKRILKVSDLPPDADREEILAALPSLTGNLVDVAQESAVRFYRKIHSHDAGGFPGTRDEFLMALMFFLEDTISPLMNGQERIRDEIHKALEAALRQADPSCDSRALFLNFSKRQESYRENAETSAGPQADLLCRFLSEHIDTPREKIRHFCGQILDDARKRIL